MTLQQVAHLLSAILSTFLGFAIWLAPHVDWSKAKDESLFGSRGLLVLGITIFIFGVNMWAALIPPQEHKVRRKP